MPIPVSDRKHRLTKDIRYTYVPGSPGSPGYPGVPAQPAYSYTALVHTCSYSPGTFDQARAELLRRIGANEDYSGSISYSADGFACTNLPTLIHVPAQPAVPPIPPVPPSPNQALEDFQLGWTGRAHSIATMTGPGRFQFRVAPSSVGVVVGLTATPRSSGYGDIFFGFYVSRGITRIMESGAEVMNLGAQLNELLEVRRSKGNIEYRVNGALVHTRVAVGGPLVLAAALYSGGDEVTDPVFEATGEGEGRGAMRPFRGISGDVSEYAFGMGTMEPFRGSSSTYARGQGEGAMLPFKGRAGRAYAVGEGVMRPFQGQAESLGSAPSYALAAGSMLPMTGRATGLTGGVGSGSGRLRPFTGFAGEGAFAAGRGVMLPFRSTVYNLTPPGVSFMSNYPAMRTDMVTSTILHVVMNSAMEVEGLIVATGLAFAVMPNAMGAGTTMLTTSQLEAILASVMSAQGLAADGGDEKTVWALNTESNASTRYSNYGFNSFAKVGQQHYGAKSDGLYLLRGRDDDGEDVDAEVNFGNLNFGLLERKSLPHVYAGVASDGKLVLKVTAEGQTYYYQLRGYREELSTQRFDLGRGLRANYYELVLQNHGGAKFDLATIEFSPIKLSRRL